MNNYKSLNLEELEDQVELNIDLLNKASEELKRIENILKKGVIFPFEIKINDRLTFYWNTDDRRLYMIFDKMDRRALESKARARVYAFNYLEKFVEELKNKIKEK